jgi:radical SAM protein with 4Fe4S-binding SPASM domain
MNAQKNTALPMAMTLHLTEACNLRCKMCYYWGEKGAYSTAESKENPKVLELELIKELVETVKARKPMYSLFGGEPLMHPDIEQVIMAIKDAGSFIDTPTNGTLLEKHAQMIVRTGFDSIRVSLDGPREENDVQRGEGTFDKAMAGIEALHNEKQKTNSMTPGIQIIYTVTPDNYLAIEKFFLEELNLDAIGMITIQMVNFLTQEMGEAYAEMMESVLGITSDTYWHGMVQPPDIFSDVDTIELVRQVDAVKKKFAEMKKMVLLLPPTFTPENLSAYLAADWGAMADTYKSCPVPWAALDVVASGDIAPCHVFFDLTVGNLHEQSISEIWNGERYNTFRGYMKEHGLMPICHVGCCILYLAGIR